jgi:hypothetical protein
LTIQSRLGTGVVHCYYLFVVHHAIGNKIAVRSEVTRVGVCLRRTGYCR